MWFVIFHQGTSHRHLFARRKLLFIVAFTTLTCGINIWVGAKLKEDRRLTEFAFPSVHNFLCTIHVCIVYMQLAFNINLTGYLVDFKGQEELSGQEKMDQKLGLDINDEDELEDFQLLERAYSLKKARSSIKLNSAETIKSDQMFEEIMEQETFKKEQSRDSIVKREEKK